MRKNTIICLALLGLICASACDQAKKMAENNLKQKKYVGPKDELELDWAIDHYGQKVAKEHDLKYVLAGSRGAKKNYSYGLAFRSTKPTMLDDGRILAADLVENFWQMLKDDPAQIKYVRSRRDEERNFPDGLPIDQVFLKLSFVDEKKKSLQAPYLMEILFERGNFYYYQIDPTTKKKKLLLTESYQAGLNFRDSF